MKKCNYPRGNRMTFPLELAQIREEKGEQNLNYMYAAQIKELQSMVSLVCDQMEYQGSMMYDCYPDKATGQRMAGCICSQFCQKKDLQKEKKWIYPMTEVMLCSEMEKRRACHRERNRSSCH